METEPCGLQVKRGIEFLALPLFRNISFIFLCTLKLKKSFVTDFLSNSTFSFHRDT